MELGPADEVIQNPKHPYTQALIDALPRFGHCGEVKHYGTLRKVPREASMTEGCAFFARCNIARRPKCPAERPLLREVNDSHWAACPYMEPGKEGRSEGREGRECFYGV
jgi:peptide/nickel transport system ATP-binding protein